jgi:hypothetical protein
MSNFSTLDTVTETNVGTAPARFVASTPDSLATILAAGYLNDRAKFFKANDLIEINYADASNFPLVTGEAALYATFQVQYDPTLNNMNLVLRSALQSGIAAYGVHSEDASNAGGSATTTITDAAITPNSVVLARWKSSANSVTIETVAPGNGSLTIVSTGDPGVSVLEYISIIPSVILQNAGVIAAQYSYAGGATTIVIANPLITASMIVNANFLSQTNASKIASVIAAAGTITIVVNTNPGASVISYSAVLPSSALTTLGYYGAAYTNAGGSATITITDTNISANSIVVADFASQANASYVYKVTPTANTLTILASADPGASVVNYSATAAAEGVSSGVYLIAANNLSDVASASTALANLGGLPLAGGQMTGSILLDRGTATSTAGAATVNHQSGVITTESLLTAAASAYAFTLTNSRITTASIVQLQLMGGTNTTRGIELRAIPGTGSATLSLYNNNVAGTALNGTLIFGFVVI